MKLHELQERRATLVTEMRGLLEKAETETRDLTGDEDTRFKAIKAEIAGLDTQIGRAQALEAAERSAPAVVSQVGDGRFEERAREFSITRAIRAALPRDVGGGGVDASFEAEISAEVQRRAGRVFQGIACPDEIFQVERRTLLAGSSAADLVPNVHRGDLFIDRLRSALVVERLGATVLNDLVGSPIDIPRQTGSSTTQWVAEDGSLTETDASFDDVNLSPKTVGAMTSYSRRTLINASPSIEQIVRNDLAKVIANAIDREAMLGTGTSNKPVGIVNTAGVAEFSLGSPADWVVPLTAVASVIHSDVDTGTLAWAMNSFAQRTLRALLKVDGDAAGGFAMDNPNTLVGYKVGITSALPGIDEIGANPAVAATVIFGNWSDLLVGYWSGVDILLNPYETTAYAKGRVLVRAMRDVDVAVRHPQSFTFADDLAMQELP